MKGKGRKRKVRERLERGNVGKRKCEKEKGE